MTRLECHELLAELYADDAEQLQSWLPEGTEPVSFAPGVDSCVLLLTAAASLSGGLEDCEGKEELRELIDHFRGLYAAGIIDTNEWSDEANEVLHLLLEWGARQTCHELN